LTGPKFDNEDKGQLASYLHALLTMTIRNFVYGFLSDGNIIQFFEGSIKEDSFIVKESPVELLNQRGGKQLMWLLHADPHQLGFITHSIVYKGINVKVNGALGRGGFSIAYIGVFEGEKIVAKLYIGGEKKHSTNEANILQKIQTLCPYVPQIIGFSDDYKALLMKPVAIAFSDSRVKKKNADVVELRSEHLVHLVEVLQLVHKLGIVHRDIKPANFFCHEEPNKIMLNDWACAAHKDELVEFAGTYLFTSSNLLLELTQHETVLYRPHPKHDLESVVKCLYLAMHPFFLRDENDNINKILFEWDKRLSKGVWRQMMQDVECCNYDSLKKKIDLLY